MSNLEMYKEMLEDKTVKEASRCDIRINNLILCDILEVLERIDGRLDEKRANKQDRFIAEYNMKIAQANALQGIDLKPLKTLLQETSPDGKNSEDSKKSDGSIVPKHNQNICCDCHRMLQGRGIVHYTKEGKPYCPNCWEKSEGGIKKQ